MQCLCCEVGIWVVGSSSDGTLKAENKLLRIFYQSIDRMPQQARDPNPDRHQSSPISNPQSKIGLIVC
ncbi:hypothetical protein [Microcoleus sp. A006_D1]|uniref:hypothetical protein n=1 Tax=Microcoleus sp. A006_D1 TaxID=3055267 RepID=UPI002FD4AAD7